MNPILHDLQNKQWLWTGAHAKQTIGHNKLTSGFDDLDKVLSGGFPSAGMIHLESHLGCGEIRLMLAMLQHAYHHQKNDHLNHVTPTMPNEHKLYVFINPPFELNAEFLLAHRIALSQLVVVNARKHQTDALWSAEQCVKSGACRAVFIWQEALSHTHIKKIELAAQQGGAYCIWLDIKHSSQTLKHNLPLSLSLSISRENDTLCVRINKQKIGWAQKSVNIPLPFNTQTNASVTTHSYNNSLANVVDIHANKVHAPG